jgi:hypothetical protein
MMESFDHILLFKTSCTNFTDRQGVKALMENQPGIADWNLDQEDCDCVLRIISYELHHDQIIQLMNDHGYACCELI